MEHTTRRPARHRTALALARLIDAIELIATGAPRAPDLADELGVCERTVYRDLAALRAAGLRVRHDGRRYLIDGAADLARGFRASRRSRS